MYIGGGDIWENGVTVPQIRRTIKGKSVYVLRKGLFRVGAGHKNGGAQKKRHGDDEE
jgi:hypothetical protein